jgi:D-3-phosphoglycerate dehydrogenase
LDNVVITPHAAYYPEEAIGTVRRFAAEEVVRVLPGSPRSRRSTPAISSRRTGPDHHERR